MLVSSKSICRRSRRLDLYHWFEQLARAGLVRRPWRWPWSSAAAHVAGRGDALIAPGGRLAAEVNDWRAFLRTADDEATLEALRRHGRTGRPLGSPAFIERLETAVGRTLRPKKPGPKPRPQGS